jgi:preprotein translocase subunit SecF
MKKIFSILTVAFFIAGTLSSCSKDFECHCEFSDGTEQEFDYEGVKKNDAKDACEAQEAIFKIADPEVECHLD